jgi:hypothetical protein
VTKSEPVATASADDAARSMRSTTALPTTTPSAKPAMRDACSGVETPKPTQTGTSENARTARTSLSSVAERSRRAPVVPVSDTK